MSALEPRPGDGVIDVTDLPYVDRDEAERVVTEAFTLLRTGQEGAQEAQRRIERGREMLALAERRQAWRVLGFQSWDDCMLDGISRHLRHVLDPAVRQRLAVEMRVREQSTLRQIAEAFDVSHPTILRDLRAARASGELDEADEPRPPRRTVPEQPPVGHRGTVRPDLARTWRNHTADLVRKGRALQKLREDNRYTARLDDLTRTRADLMLVQQVVTAILADFDQLHAHEPG